MTVTIDLGSLAGNLGTGAGSAPALLDLEELLATRLLVQGNSGSGKSHLLRRLLEQSAGHVQQVVIDPEGDFVGLAERFGHVVVEAERGLADIEAIAARVRQHRVSAVLSLDSLDAENQMRAAAAFLNGLFDADRDHWFPLLVVVDEAQLFAPAVGGDVADDARKQSLGAMTNLMCRGRKRGLAGVIATQRLAKLAKNVAAEATNFLMGRTFLDIDMARAADLLGLERRQAETFRELPRGQFVALGPALSRRPVTVRVGGVETQPRAGTPLLTPLPEQPAAEAREMILAAADPAFGRAQRPRSAPPSTDQLLAAIDRDAPVFEPAATEPAPAPMDPMDRAAALAGIAFALLAEPDATFRPEAVLYQDFGVRCRLMRLPGGRVPLREFRLLLAEARAGMDPAEAATHAGWALARDRALDIPEDLQAVYLILAAAALRGAPCPADEEVSRRCGHHSAGRARSRIGHLEKRDLVVVSTDPAGRRTVSLPDLGWTSAPGDPAPSSIRPLPRRGPAAA